MYAKRGLKHFDWSYLWAAALLIPSAVWIFEDHWVWQGDQADYGQACVNLWYWLGRSPMQWARTMDTCLYFKAPGVAWFGQFFVPFARVFGSVERSLLIYILLTQFVTLVLLYRIGLRLFPQSHLIPALGVLFASASQLFVGLSHQMYTEPLQTLVVAWIVYVSTQAREWPKARIAIHLVSALVLGALAKTTTPLYCALPCAYSAWFVVTRAEACDLPAELKMRRSRILSVAFGSLAIPCALWYYRHLRIAWQHVRESSYGDVAVHYASRDTVPHKLIAWSHLLAQSFFGPYLIWGTVTVLGLGFLLIYRRRGSPKSGRQPSVQALSIVSALQVSIVLFAFSLNITVDARYLLALLPSAAIVFMQVCALLPGRLLAALFMVAAVQFAHVNALSLNLVRSISDQSEWLAPVQADRSRYDELTRAVQIASAAQAKPNLIAVEYWLNIDAARFFEAKRHLKYGSPVPYEDYGWAQKDVDAAMRRIDDAQPAFVLTLAEPYNEVSVLNPASIQVLKRMRQDPRFTPVPFQSRNGLLLFQFQPNAARGISNR